MAITTTLHYPKGQQFLDASGKILSGGCLFFFAATTTTPQTVYLDAAGVTPYTTGTVNGVPYIQLDSAGRLDQPIYLGQAYSYKEVLTDYTGATSGITGANIVSPWPWDNIPIAPSAGTTSTFTLPYNPVPTVTSSSSPVTLTAANAGNAYEVDTSGGNVQFLLPDATAVTKGAYYRFKKISASNTVTFTPTAQTIDGASSFVLAALNSAILIESDGANWKIWSSYGFPGSVDLQEISAPAAPSSGVLRAYAASNDILTVQGSGGVKQPLGAGLPGVTGLTIANDPSYLTTKIDVTISAGLCVNQYGMVLPVAAGTYYCATGSIGIGGLDISSTLTGTNGLDLYLYLVTNGSTSGVLASLTAPSTGPSLVNAAGYTYSCYIGAVKLDSSGNLYLTRQRGRDAQYVIAASGNTTAFPFSASGSTFNTWTAERVTGSGYAFPSTAVRGKFIYGTGGTSGYCAVAPNANYGAPSGTISNPWAPNSYYGYGIGEADFVLESNSVYYWSNQANSLLQYIGWTDAVNAC